MLETRRLAGFFGFDKGLHLKVDTQRPSIRIAEPADAKQLSRFAEISFRDAYEEKTFADDMSLYCAENFSEEVQRNEILNQKVITLLSEYERAPAGFVQIFQGEAPSCAPAKSPYEIRRFYVAQEWHGRGVAQDLMKSAISTSREQGADMIWLGVWEENPRAVKFYKKFGFAELGEQEFLFGKELQRDIVMVLRI